MNCNSSLLRTLFIKLPCLMRQRISHEMIRCIKEEARSLDYDLQNIPDSPTKGEMLAWGSALKELEDLIKGTEREVSRKESEYARIRREIYREMGDLKEQDPANYRLTVEGALGMLNRLLK